MNELNNIFIYNSSLFSSFRTLQSTRHICSLAKVQTYESNLTVKMISDLTPKICRVKFTNYNQQIVLVTKTTITPLRCTSVLGTCLQFNPRSQSF